MDVQVQDAVVVQELEGIQKVEEGSQEFPR
jgi:hypothetical protein